MFRISRLLLGAAALLLLAPPAAAEPTKPRVRPVPTRAATLKTRTIAPAKRVPLAKVRRNTIRTAARNRPLIQNRRVALPLKSLSPAARTRVVKLLSSPRLRSTPQARTLVANYLQLYKLQSGKQMPLSIGDLEQIARSDRWTPTRMSNLARVLRLAHHIAGKEKISPKAAFDKALKAAGIYKQYKSGTCKV